MLTQSTWQQYNATTGEGAGTPALTRWIYDPATGQLAQKQHADGKGPSYGYTPGGRLASRTWARGTSTTYVYDDAGMMASLDHSDSTPDVAFSYTRTGQLDTVQDGALSGSGIATPRFTHSYTYSSIGQLTTETSNTTVGRTLTRVYEIDGTVPGRPIGWDLHTPDDPVDAPSHWQRYGFDGAGRLNAVSSPAGEYSYTYVDQSHLLASVTGPVHTVTNSYESGRDVMTSKTNQAASGLVSRFGAKYDALGRRVEVNRSVSAFAQNFVSGYQYDLLGQLTKDERFSGAVPGDPAQKLEDESFGFLYDGIGNRLTAQKGNGTTAYTPNALNQYTAIDGIEPVYDADGNLFSDGKNRYHWDAENRLTLVEPLVPTEGSKRLEFKYDYIGRRVSKQVWTHTGGSWTDESTTAFVYDGWNLIEEISTSSATASINHYTWGLDLSGSLQGAGGVGGLLSVVWAPFTESGLIGDWLLPIGYLSPAPSTFHYTFDLNGNVSELLDSTGSIAAHYEYGPFGESLVEYNSTGLGSGDWAFRFSTKYYDAELKTSYYGYRYYDPAVGRFLSRDPLEEEGGVNIYGFVENDAVNVVDYLGQYTLKEAEESLENKKILKLGSKTVVGHSGKSFHVSIYTKQQIFDEWVVLERDDPKWLENIPDCPSEMCINNGTPVSCNNGIFGELSDGWAVKKFHPDADYCMRSISFEKSAQQCCYKKMGNKLILLDPSSHSAGTPDRVAAVGWLEVFNYLFRPRGQIKILNYVVDVQQDNTIFVACQMVIKRCRNNCGSS